MYVAKFIALTAALFAVAEVEARKGKKKHHKKTKDAVSRSCINPRDATFVIDGVSKSVSRKLVNRIPNDVQVTFLLNMDEIRSRRNNKFLKALAAKKEHTLAFRYRSKYDSRRFHKAKPKRLVQQAMRANKLFSRNYGIELKYVFFPWTRKHLVKQVAAVEAAGFKVFGNNLYVDKNFRRNGKGKLKRAIRRLHKIKKGSIIYQTTHNTRVAEDRDWVEYNFERKGFNIVSIDQCLAPVDDSTDEEIIVEGRDPVMAGAQQAPVASVEDAAAVTGISTAAAVAFGLLMLVL